MAGHRVNASSAGIELEREGDTFPATQVVAAERLIRRLVQTYPIKDLDAMHRHREYDAARRSDPGPVWQAMLPELVRPTYE